MSLTMTGVVTGAPVTGLTSPTATLTADNAADAFTAQSVVSALGGTQTGVLTHSIASPFTVTQRRQKVLKILPKVNVAGYLASVGRNTYSTLFRKGLTVLAGQPFQIGLTRFENEIPAGAETADQINLKGWISFIAGFIYSNTNGYVAMWTDGIIK